MRPQDIVAIILAVGVVIMLLSGTGWVLLFLTPEQVAARPSATEEFWTNIVSTILGALAGYIAGRKHDD